MLSLSRPLWAEALKKANLKRMNSQSVLSVVPVLQTWLRDKLLDKHYIDEPLEHLILEQIVLVSTAGTYPLPSHWIGPPGGYAGVLYQSVEDQLLIPKSSTYENSTM